MYLGELGLHFADYPTQTHVFEEEGVIACIGDSNLQRVKGIYNRSDYSPRIINLMGEDYPDINKQWVLTYDEFRNVARDVKEATIELLNRNS